jgi:hypothetical protein
MSEVKNGWVEDEWMGILTRTHYVNDLIHNEDGAAVTYVNNPPPPNIPRNYRIYPNIKESYYLGGVPYPKPLSDLEWLLTVKKWKEAGCVTNGIIVTDDGDMFYYQNNKLHNEDGPAAMWSNCKTDLAHQRFSAKLWINIYSAQ